MLFRQLFDSVSCTYTYLIADQSGGEALLIDPVLEKIPLYGRLIDEMQLRLIFAIDTHVHADHITALGQLRDVYRCATIHGEQSHARCVSRTVSDGEYIGLNSVRLKALYTPGHTDDSYCFLLEREVESLLFSGDTLLIRSTGRTDFQNGDAIRQYQSIFDKLLALPDDTLVYPGHDYNGVTVSTIGEERRFNPRLRVNNAGEYEGVMDSLNLPNPKLIDVAVPRNRNCGKQQ